MDFLDVMVCLDQRDRVYVCYTSESTSTFVSDIQGSVNRVIVVLMGWLVLLVHLDLLAPHNSTSRLAHMGYFSKPLLCNDCLRDMMHHITKILKAHLCHR